MRVTVALRDDGEIGAFTELRVSSGSTLGFTDDTGTVAAHRGQGLARAVKLESLRRLRDDHPEIEVVSTSNAEENAAMRHSTTRRLPAERGGDDGDAQPVEASVARYAVAFVPRNRTVRLAVLGSSVQRAAPSGFPSSSLQRPQAPDRRGVSSCWPRSS